MTAIYISELTSLKIGQNIHTLLFVCLFVRTLMVVFQGRIPRPKGGYPMCGPKVGPTGLVLRLGLKVGSRGKVPSQCWVPWLGSKV